MSIKKRGLGRGLGDLGLSELLSDMQHTSIINPVVTQEVESESKLPTSLREIPIDKIQPGPYQPRKTFDQNSLEELAQSIRTQGILQPIVLRPKNNLYEIVAGERRWRGAQLAGLQQIPAIVRDIPDEAAVAVGLIENIQRRDLNAIEEASALQRLILEFQLTHQEVADAIGKSRALVTNLLRLLKLNPDVRLLVENGHLEMGHARALLSLEGLKQSEVANEIVSRSFSVRQTEEWVRCLLKAPKSSTPQDFKTDPNTVALQKELSEKLGARVVIHHNAKGKGKLIMYYHNLNELEGILGKIH